MGDVKLKLMSQAEMAAEITRLRDVARDDAEAREQLGAQVTRLMATLRHVRSERDDERDTRLYQQSVVRDCIESENRAASLFLDEWLERCRWQAGLEMAAEAAGRYLDVCADRDLLAAEVSTLRARVAELEAERGAFLEDISSLGGPAALVCALVKAGRRVDECRTRKDGTPAPWPDSSPAADGQDKEGR